MRVFRLRQAHPGRVGVHEVNFDGVRLALVRHLAETDFLRLTAAEV